MELNKKRKRSSDGDGELSALNFYLFHYSSVIYTPSCWLTLTLNMTKASNNEAVYELAVNTQFQVVLALNSTWCH